MKKYEELTIEFVLLMAEDVIRTSGNENLDNGGETPEFPEIFG